MKPNAKLQLLKQQPVAVNLTCAGTYSVITQMYCTGKNTVTAFSTQTCPVKWLHVKGLQRLFLVRSPDLEEGGVGGDWGGSVTLCSPQSHVVFLVGLHGRAGRRLMQCLTRHNRLYL